MYSVLYTSKILEHGKYNGTAIQASQLTTKFQNNSGIECAQNECWHIIVKVSQS